ncbi:MAG: hypothetical protein RR140_03185 [Clostridia bacterium]
MSFYINNTNPNRPGPMCGNPVQGICEKVLIETTKVFDACVSQITESGLALTATNFQPANPALPLTFISAENNPATPATLSNVIISRIDCKPNYANVTGTLLIPIIITYRDANGVIGTATSVITQPVNSVLFVPQPSVTPVTIKALAALSSQVGTFTSPNVFVVTICLEIIIKVVATVDILVPSYGYPQIPPCQAGTTAECPGFFNTPLYPTAVQR